jgi:hypothetical protein
VFVLGMLIHDYSTASGVSRAYSVALPATVTELAGFLVQHFALDQKGLSDMGKVEGVQR